MRLIWGVFDKDKSEIHVAPVDKNKHIAIGHTLNMGCPCNPTIEASEKGVIVIHKDDQ